MQKVFLRIRVALARFKSGRGFALLFAVLLSSVLISIGLSIFNISIKELSLATAERDSVAAYYAADSARECAIWNGIVKGVFPACLDESCSTNNLGISNIGQSQTVSFSCASSTSNTMTFNLSNTNPPTFSGTSTLFMEFPGWPAAPDADINISNIFCAANDTQDSPCDQNTSGFDVIFTEITTNGHNSGIIGRRVERGMSFGYTE